MFVDSVSTNLYSVYSNLGARRSPDAANEPAAAAGTQVNEDGDTVQISPAAQAAITAQDLKNGLLNTDDIWRRLGDTNGDGMIDGKEFQAHHDRLMADAEQGLKSLASQYRVDLSKVTIRTDETGRIVVEGDDPNAAQMEAAINENGDLRNTIVGAQNSSIYMRLGKAIGMAVSAADSDPSRADEYYAWLQSVAKQTRSMDMVFSFKDGELMPEFESVTGQRIGVFEGLRESALAAGLPESALG